MMKRFIFSAVIGVFCFSSACAGSPMPDGVYAGAHGGAAIPTGDNNSSVDTGYIVGGQLGYRLTHVRVEGEFSFIRNSVAAFEAVQTNVTTYMANGYYDIPVSDRFSPYLGAGMGFAHGWASDTVSNQSTDPDNQFAYQLIGGLGYNVTPAVTLAFQYRYLSFADNNNDAVSGLEGVINYAFSV